MSENANQGKAPRPTHQAQKWDSLKTQATAPFGVNRNALTDCMFVPKQEREGLLTKVGGIDGIAQALLSDKNKGINDTDTVQMEQRRTVLGVNRLPPPKVKSFLATFFEAATYMAKDRIKTLLTVAAIILGLIFYDKGIGWVGGTAIIVAVFIVILSASFNKWSKERKLREDNDFKDDLWMGSTVTVFRNGVKKEVSTHDVVVGDVLRIRIATKLCADGILIEGWGLEMDESTVTGDSKVRKGETGDADRFFYSGEQFSSTVQDNSRAWFPGTTCMLGEGLMMVTCVGETSFAGMAAMALRREEEQ